MKKAFIGILLSFVSLFALDDLTVPNRFASQGVIRASEFNQNNDTISVKFNRLNDSLEIKFVRFSDFSDSTIKKIKVDSIRSNPDIDSIKGNPFIDSISSLFAKLTTSTIDSLNNRIIIAETGAFSGVINADTVHSTKGISATSGNFSSYINVDSLKSTKGISATTGTFTGDVVSSGDIYSTGLTDISSTCVVVGWDTLTTKSIYYRKIGKQATVYFDLKGTAHPNIISAHIYKIPIVTSSTITKTYANCYAKDSSGVLTNAVAKVEKYHTAPYESTSYIDFYIDHAQSRAWPTSGEKEVYGSITFLAEE